MNNIVYGIPIPSNMSIDDGKKTNFQLKTNKFFLTHLLKTGPPKHADMAILGKPFLAIDKLDRKSPILLPHAPIVRPIINLLRLNMTRTASNILTTSLAIA